MRFINFYAIPLWTLSLAILQTQVHAYSTDFRDRVPEGQIIARYDFEMPVPAEVLAPGTHAKMLRFSEGDASVDGSRSLIAESPGRPDSWNVFFKTPVGLLERNKHYRVRLEYKALAPWEDNSYAYLFIRSSEQKARWRPAPSLMGEPGQPTQLAYNFLTGDENNCSISLGIRNKGIIAIDNIVIEELPLLPEVKLQPATDKNSWADNMGVCAHLDWLHFYHTEDQVLTALDKIAALGVGWIRLTFAWDWLFPDGPDEPNPAALQRADFIVSEAQKRNLQLLVILIAPPAWASSGEDASQAWRYAARDLGQYEDYVRFVATRFKGRITHWEINNETNWEHFWLSSFDAYLRELRVASRILRQIDSNNVILCAGLTDAGLHSLPQSTPEALRLLLEPENAAAYDIFSIHLYPGTPIESVYMTNSVLATMQEMGVVKPIWITETGYSVFEDRTVDQQAAFTTELIPLLTAHPNVGKVFLYNERVKDFESSPYEQGFGLMNTDFSLRPLYHSVMELLRKPPPAKEPKLLPPPE